MTDDTRERDTARHARQRDALRENLKRRKSQARGRAMPPDADAPAIRLRAEPDRPVSKKPDSDGID